MKEVFKTATRQLFGMKFCKSCQYCMENMYWKCCEERFCFDKSIASYRFEDDSTWRNGGITNLGASLDSVVLQQPQANNNHLPQAAISDVRRAEFPREVTDLPINANKIYEVFSKSMIFRDELDLENDESTDSFSNNELQVTKSEPDLTNVKSSRSVYFEDEVGADGKMTDFEIMFKEELLGNHKMSKIDEEGDTAKEKGSSDFESSPEEGLTMKEIKSSYKDKRPKFNLRFAPTEEERLSTPPKPVTVHEYDPESTVSRYNIPLKSVPRAESVKGILRISSQKNILRTLSTKSLYEVEGAETIQRVSKNPISRVESLRNIDTKTITKVLSRVPQRSASFLSIPEHLLPPQKVLGNSDTVFTISVPSMDSIIGERPQVSHLPDTPIIKSVNLPKFFADSPVQQEYKGECSLSSIQVPDVIFAEYDYSMPRYYGKIAVTTDPVPVHESKSMPDLRSAMTAGKVSKRLVKLRSRLKPLIIKKGHDDLPASK